MMGWPGREPFRLLGRLYFFYMLALLLGTSFIFLNNIFLHGIPWVELLRFNVPFVMGSDVVLALLLLGITHGRLRPFIRFLKAGTSHGRGGGSGDQTVLFRRLTRFPTELSVGMLGLSVLFMAAYHVSEAVFSGVPHEPSELLDNLLSELSISLVLAILLFTLARVQLRPYVRLLRVDSLEGFHSRTLLHSIVYTSAGCLAFTMAASIRFILSRGRQGEAFDWIGFSWYTGIYAGFGLAIFALHLLDLRRQLGSLIRSLHSLYRSSKAGMHRPVPLFSLDEGGQLADAFNALQRKVSRTYEEVEQQLKLASGIQQQLLPERLPELPGLSMEASCEQCREVGGDFYDCHRIGEHRWAVAVGDVSGKGLPAALLMSAVLMGLRTEAEAGGSAGEILTRLNRHVHAMTGGRMYATLGLAVMDLSPGTCKVEYASAGHLEPYVLRDGRVEEWPCSSMPMGMDPEAVYLPEVLELGPGDGLVLYTDGIVEADGSGGEMLGFDGWRQVLERYASAGGREGDADPGLANLLAQLPRMNEAEPQDDRTVVLIRWH